MKKIIVASDDAIYGVTHTEPLSSDEPTSVVLHRANVDNKWTEPGSICGSITDWDNYLALSIGKKNVKLQYHEACELLIILQEYFKAHPDQRMNYKVYVEEL